jgi:hypothetical protein
MLVINPAGSLDAVGHAFVESIQTPFWEGYSDDRDLESAAFFQRIEGGEDHLMGEIAGHAEEDQGVGVGEGQ